MGYCIVTDGYFETMGIRLLSGRCFTAADQAETVIIVNETFASRFFPNQSAPDRR